MTIRRNKKLEMRFTTSCGMNCKTEAQSNAFATSSILIARRFSGTSNAYSELIESRNYSTT